MWRIVVSRIYLRATFIKSIYRFVRLLCTLTLAKVFSIANKNLQLLWIVRRPQLVQLYVLCSVHLKNNTHLAVYSPQVNLCTFCNYYFHFSVVADFRELELEFPFQAQSMMSILISRRSSCKCCLLFVIILIGMNCRRSIDCVWSQFHSSQNGNKIYRWSAICVLCCVANE